ncbi:MAG TPA: hypothetical protein DEF42_16775 [Desulfosporosinus sp.]|nr:hypothetical protein [Desulfosporosinus sp.]
MDCKNCNTPLKPGSLFCSNCGTKNEDVISEASAAAGEEEEITPTKGKRFFGLSLLGKPKLKILLSGLVIIILIILGIKLLPFGSSADNFVVYTKDNELVSRNLKEDKSFTLTSSFMEDKQTDMFIRDTYLYGKDKLAFKSEDGKSMFYFDSITNEGVGNLYLKKLSDINEKKADDKGTKISSGVNFMPRPELLDNESIIYMKEYKDDEGGRLYVHTPKEEIKIDGEIFEYQVSSDGKYVYYIKDMEDGIGDLYVKELENDSEKLKIDTEVTNIKYLFKDGKKVYYAKKDDPSEFTYALFAYEFGKEKNKVFGDYSLVKSVNEDTVVFTRAVEVKFGFSDLFEDDMANADKSLARPSKPDAKSYQKIVTSDWYGDYTTTDYDAYYAAYETYNNAMQKYSTKAERDKVRNYYTENPVEITRYDLYQYSEGKEQKIDENIAFDGVFNFPEKGSAMVYPKLDPTKSTKQKMSEVTYFGDVEEYRLRNMIRSSPEANLILRTSGGKNIELGSQKKIKDLYGNEDFSTLNFLNDYDYDKNLGTYMEYSIDSTSIKDKKTIDEDVSMLDYYKNWSIAIYYKDQKQNVGEMYIRKGDKKEKVADDVYEYNIASKDDGDNIYCLTDFSTKDYSGKLTAINNFKKTVIADDVSDYYLRDNSDVLYLKDFNREKQRGELWLKAKSDSQKIDDDVSNVISY